MHHNIKRSRALALVLTAAGAVPGCHLGGQSFDDGRDGLDGTRTTRPDTADDAADASAGLDAQSGASLEFTSEQPSEGSPSPSSGGLPGPSSVSPSPTVYDSQGPRSDSTVLGGICGGTALPDVPGTKQERLESLKGRWVLCSGGGGMFDEPHVGIDLYEDGSWALLSYDSEGELQPQRGFDGEGILELGDDSYDLGFEFLANLKLAVGSFSFMTRLENEGALMRLTNSDGFGDYQRQGDAPTPSLPDAGVSNSDDRFTIAGAEACPLKGDAITDITTEASTIEHMVGRWVFCSGVETLGLGEGVEFREDGTWATLGYDAAGEPQSQADANGTWKLQENAPGYFQIGLTTLEGNFELGYLGFTENPSAMRFRSSSGTTNFARE